MIELMHSNTDYAERLDFEQQLDYEDAMYGHETLEEEEERRFAEVCFRAKASVRKMRMCERAIAERTEGIRKEIDALEEKVFLVTTDTWYRNRYKITDKTLEQWRFDLAVKRKKYDEMKQAISNEFFAKKKGKKGGRHKAAGL